MRFSHEYEPADATDGMAVTMTLATQAVELPIETTGVRLDMDDLFILEAEIEADARLRDLLLSDGPLTIQIGNDVQTFTLEGAYAPAKDLLKACTPS